MPSQSRTFCCFPLLILAGFFAAAEASADEAKVSFRRDVLPVLAKTCFQCHGPDDDHRKADLRLDDGELVKKSDVLAPGKPDESEFVRRILSKDPDERMPPPDAKQQLTKQQIDLLKRWVAEGAQYTKHWAFVPPGRPELPKAKGNSWVRNPIDAFVLSRLQRAGIGPAPMADKYTLVRRVYLDLVGVPPTPEEADRFANDPDPQAYERLVDQLIQSPAYGERWARKWMDLARYADTNGYEKDRERSIWPFRDWVIRSINAGMTFDQFTIEQIAGDMLPNATPMQRIATGFHRNTMLNEEGGIDPLEYRFYAMVDRVATTGTVWLGLTVGCAQCHTHKYDPITHSEYYQMLALLNNADEPDFIVPNVDVATRRKAVDQQIAKLELSLKQDYPAGPGAGPKGARSSAAFEAAFKKWLESQKKLANDWTVIRPVVMKTNLPRLEVLRDGSIFSTGDITKRDVFTLTFDVDGSAEPVTAIRLEVLPDERLPAGGPGRAYYEGRKGTFFLSELKASVGGKSIGFSEGSNSFGKISIGRGSGEAKNVFDNDGSTGWGTAGHEGKANTLVLNLAKPLTNKVKLQIEMLFERHFAASLGRFRFATTSNTEPVRALKLSTELEATLAKHNQEKPAGEALSLLERQFVRNSKELAKARKKINQLANSRPKLPVTMIMKERPEDNPRVTHRHHRGEYLSPRETVKPGLPRVLPAIAKGQPANRLSFARWLVSRQNPLSSRVTVNRAWRDMFGHGIVRTSGDFGIQSSPPTHPELLDWLAVEFMEQGWDSKWLHKMIVTSATYRQAGRIRDDLPQADPQNFLLARGPRVRLEAETIRDAMLASGGLLTEKIGGPSVRPPQPRSVTALAYGGTAWPVSEGEDRYRRSLYTYAKRTAPFAATITFDGPTGENCLPRRTRSNTPLQALTLLNDPMFQEIAHELGRRAVLEKEDSRERASWIFRRLLTRIPSEDEIDLLTKFQEKHDRRIATGELKPAKILADAKLNRDAASWSLVARAIMNLDEAIVKP